MSSSLNIGLVAYAVTPELVFVRAPTERGRWMLVCRSVVEVDCEYCGAITGEPCKTKPSKWANPPALPKYHVAVHCDRKAAAIKKLGRGYSRREKPHKLRLTAAELGEIQATQPKEQGEQEC